MQENPSSLSNKFIKKKLADRLEDAQEGGSIVADFESGTSKPNLKTTRSPCTTLEAQIIESQSRVCL